MDRSATIVIVTCGRLAKSSRCIESIKDNTDYPYKLIVIDNGSNDETPKYLMEHKSWFDCLLLLDKNLGTAKAHNIGWMLSDKEYYLKVDDDIVIHRKEWLEVLVGMANMLPEYHAFGHIWFDSKSRKNIRGFYIADKDNGIDFYSPVTLIPKRTFDVLGYWTSAFGVYGFEDFDYRIRMHLANMQYCYAGDINFVEHLGPNMDPKDGEKLFNEKLKSRTEGENIRFQLVKEYEEGLRPLKIFSPM